MRSRKRSLVSKATPVASSNYRSLKTKKNLLVEGHKDRMKAISLMTFSIKTEDKEVESLKRHGRPYTNVWGKRVFADYDRIKSARMNVYWA